MKIRIGVGSAGATASMEAMAELVAGLDEFGFDSLWLSEVLTGAVVAYQRARVGSANQAERPGCASH